MIAGIGNEELLKCILNDGIDKDSADQNSWSDLCWVVSNGSNEAVRCFLDLGVAVPSYKLEQYKKNKFPMYNTQHFMLNCPNYIFAHFCLFTH